MLIYILLLSLFYSLVFSVEVNSTCTTPNGERATCIPINSCTVIKQAITYLNEEAINFARASHCGQVNGTHLICCGPSANFRKVTASTPAPATQPPRVNNAFPQPPVPIENVHLPDHSLCGIQDKQFRIVGGTSAEIDEFPWMVALKYVKDEGSDGGYRCSGTLINQRYVLTAAQCLNIKGFKLIAARLGEWRLSTDIDCTPDTQHQQTCADPVVDVKIKRIVPHPYFSKRTGNNDIALLHLAEKVNYTDFIRPICLPPEDYPPVKPGMPLLISGWGFTENGTQSDVKLKVEIPVVKNEVCAKIYPSTTTVNSNQVCAGGEQGKDACRGDSGGPLMRTFDKSVGEEEQWFQEAIIYRGLGCGRKGVPGLYTRLSRYVNWILNEIKKS